MVDNEYWEAIRAVQATARSTERKAIANELREMGYTELASMVDPTFTTNGQAKIQDEPQPCERMSAE